MAPWLRFLEAYMVQALLRTPAFHRAVEKVARGVHRLRHGVPPDEMGGTKIDQPGDSGFSKHFLEEIKTQMGYAEQKDAAQAVKDMKDGRVDVRASKQAAPEEETSDSVWQNAQKNSEQQSKGGFLQEYMDALRDQMKNGKSGR